MLWVWVLPSAVVFAVSTTAFGSSPPSIFSNPDADFSRVRKVALIGFTVDAANVQDPFAAQKAGVYFTSGLKSVGLSLVDINDVLQRVQTDTGIDLSKQLSQSELEKALAGMAKYLDAVFVGRVGVWGVYQKGVTRVFPVYSWRSDGTWGHANVPIPSSRDVSVVGASLAMLQLGVAGGWGLVWQYTHLRIHEGGYDILRRAPPDPPDKVAEAFFQDVAKVLPIRP